MRHSLLCGAVWGVVVCAILLPGQRSAGQAVAPGSEDVRHNLEEATRASALETEGTPAFRLEASFDTFDYMGKPDGSGTLVEEWLKPGVSRRVVTYRGLTWTQVSQGGSVRESGSSFQGSFMERRVIHALLHAGPSAAWLKSATPTYKEMTVGAVELDCAILARTDVPATSNRIDKRPSAFCLSRNPRLVRLVQERYDLSLTWNRFARLNGHQVGQDVSIQQYGRPRANIHVTSLKAAPEMKDSDFTFPLGLDTSDEDLQVAGNTLAARILKKVQPRYPDDARLAHISGDVTLGAIIDKTGKVERLEVIAAPLESLARAALDAVKEWRYTPYISNGVPVEVDTNLTVNFSIAH